MSSFSLELTTLRPGSNSIQVEAEPDDLGLPPEGWPGRVFGDFLVERSGDRVSVRGKLRAAAWLECVRCLKAYETTLQIPFEVFAERAGTGVRVEEEELERDDYMLFHDGRHLDLRGQAREALLLELPIAPHCREDCAGLCPRCGVDLNDAPCACAMRASGLEQGPADGEAAQH